MDTAATRVGYVDATDGHRCDAVTETRNKLGFRLANCEETRYGYYIAGADEEEFLSIAIARSDQAGSQRVFPGCDGAFATPNTVAAPTGGTLVQDRCDVTEAAWEGANSSFTSGDAWCLDHARRLDNYRDIVEYCE